MSPRLAALILAVVLLSHFLRHTFGEGAEFLIFVGIAIVFLVATLRYELTMRFLARVLGAQPNARQSLINLENSPIRHDLAWRINEAEPPVPLRAPSEKFGYPASSYTVMRILGIFALAMLALVLIVVARDPTQIGNPVDFAAAILVLGGGGVFFVYAGWLAVTEIEVSDQHLAVWRRSRRCKVILWTEVRRVRQTHNGVTVRGDQGTIRFSYLIQQYGRLTNLVLSRAPGDQDADRRLPPN